MLITLGQKERKEGPAAEKIKAYCERQGIDLDAIPSGENTNGDTTKFSVDTNVSERISALESEVEALTKRIEKLESGPAQASREQPAGERGFWPF